MQKGFSGHVMVNKKNEWRGVPVTRCSTSLPERCTVTFTGRSSALPAILRASAKVRNNLIRGAAGGGKMISLTFVYGFCKLQGCKTGVE